MLELKNIKKTYITSNENVEALKGVSIKFRESEFVSILGQSGCGKTTLLNIIGGLDRYTSGDLIINGKSTKKFKDRDWDAYRNYKIGFVFQSYNLISHQTVLSNVELSLTIGGISRRERKQRAIKALEDVGLKDQIHKKPNQLSGGQMQRVAIARALVNDPDIILADEPTGALDTKTSMQVMDILKKVSKNKLIIMVTHNSDLAKQYSSRIIKILDGQITEDSNPIKDDELINYNINNQKDSKRRKTIKDKDKIGRTSMSFFTAFRLSMNNLLTKKGRTLLVAFAGSIGIIGIALVQSVSNGFQSYVDKIQEDTLTSYPLMIMQEDSDITGTLLSMVTDKSENDNSGKLEEKQYISKMLANLSTNDLKSFRDYINNNYSKIENDIATIQYNYSVEPNVYAIDATNKIVKLNPNNLFKMNYNSSFMSSFSSIYTQMLEDEDTLNESYDMLAGHWPKKYNEMVIVLSEPNSISDLLVYSLGLRDTEELTEMVTKIMSGETVDINNDPMNFTYEDLLNVKLKLIMASDLYKYNSKYDIYEDMSNDEEYIKQVYDDAIDLKIVGIVAAKEGVTTMALNPGVVYTKELANYLIDYSKDTDIVKKQISDMDKDVFSGKSFDEKKSSQSINFNDWMSIDTNKLQSAFNIKVDQKELEDKTTNKMIDISNSITTDTSEATNAFKQGLSTMANSVINSVTLTTSSDDVESIVDNYLSSSEAENILNSLEAKYVIPKSVLKQAYSGLLKGLLTVYTSTLSQYVTPDNIEQIGLMIEQMKPTIVSGYLESAPIIETVNKMGSAMTEALMKKNVLEQVGQLTGDITSSLADSYNVDQNKIASAFQMKVNEQEITRIIKAMMSDTETTAKTNLIQLGYQDKDEPTYISFYFNSFDGKENFLKFIEDYNNEMKENGYEDKVIQYTDTTGILMDSVKTIVNAVTYVLIAFVSISLVVSSFMIGIITYISVYERTKEIGILRAIGASKHNISSIFNAETFIIGLLSGLIGIGITYALIPVINSILHHFTGNIPLSATFYINNAIFLVILSVILTIIGGLIPARAASKRDPVIALRTE